MADVVSKNDVEARSVDELPRPEQFGRKNGLKELMTGAAGAVQNQDRIGDAALRVARGLPQRRVMKAQPRQGFSRLKFEILGDEIAFGCRERWCLLARRRQIRNHQQEER